MRVRVFPALALAALGLAWSLVAGCAQSPTSPTNYAPFSTTDVVAGTGAEAVTGKILTVNYTGWLYDVSATDKKGPEFGSTAATGPFTFTLGGQEVIQGWDQGVPGMKVGGVRRLVIPPSLAYGSFRNGPIPPNATLVFEIELLGVSE